MRILLTGFEPFDGDDINSSQETVKAVACDEFDDVEVVVGVLPVSFRRAAEVICSLIDEAGPNVVIMLGQSSKSDCIKIERVALNLMDSNIGDNDGYTPDEETICLGAHATYFAALHHIATVGRYSETVFIHLPKISDEWPIERMKVAINKMINNYGKEDCNS